MNSFEDVGVEGDVLQNPEQEEKPAREWSAYQLAIFRNIAEGKGHACVTATAGSGKTTVLVEGFRHVPKGCTVLMCAFNKSIAQELQSRAPAGVRRVRASSIKPNPPSSGATEAA